MVQDKRHRLCEWIKIKKQGSPNDSLRMVGIREVRKRNNCAPSSTEYKRDECVADWMEN